MTTTEWLRELGAKRPMAAAGHCVLVLGKWREGYYPIKYRRIDGPHTRDETGHVTGREQIEIWHLFGIQTAEPLTREDCERILRVTEKR